MRRLAQVLAMLAGLAVLATVPACSSGASSGGPGPSSTTAPEGGQEAATVDRILAGLDGVVGDLQRVLVRDRRITTEVTDRLRAVYVGPELLNQIDALREDVTNG